MNYLVLGEAKTTKQQKESNKPCAELTQMPVRSNCSKNQKMNGLCDEKVIMGVCG